MIKRSTLGMQKEEKILINHPGHDFMDSAPFVNSVGCFWKIPETRAYMRTRFELVEELVEFDSQCRVNAGPA